VSEDVQNQPLGKLFILILVKNDAELPIRLGYLNMNRYILENGLTKYNIF
jgi:hypothetical protein